MAFASSWLSHMATRNMSDPFHGSDIVNDCHEPDGSAVATTAGRTVVVVVGGIVLEVAAAVTGGGTGVVVVVVVVVVGASDSANSPFELSS